MGAWYGYYYPNATYIIPINITNPTNTSIDGIRFKILTPTGKINSEILPNKTLPSSKTNVSPKQSRILSNKSTRC